jgi:hypothetical protein
MRAAEARPATVSALADPMISPSLDYLPFMLNGANWSVTVEQQFPLSGIRGHRRASDSPTSIDFEPRLTARHSRCWRSGR